MCVYIKKPVGVHKDTICIMQTIIQKAEDILFENSMFCMENPSQDVSRAADILAVYGGQIIVSQDDYLHNQLICNCTSNPLCMKCTACKSA